MAGFELSVKHDVAQVTRWLTDIQKKQIPFATANALNDTAFAARSELMKQAPQKLDRPTPFTVKAFQVQKAKKLNLAAVVFVEPKRYEYLKYQIDGGTREAKGKGVGLPTANKKLDQYGNIPGRQRGLIKGKNQFIATIRGISGVWERYGSKRKSQTRLLVAFEKSVKYKPRFPFYKIVDAVAKKSFADYFRKRLDQALRSAK